MNTYHKIYNPFVRDKKTKMPIFGEWSLPEFEYLKRNYWYFTEKIDGTNIRIIWDGSCIVFKGKTDNADIPVFLLEKLHQIFCNKVELFASIFGDKPACIYGEGYGNKIQKVGSLYLPDSVDFIVFDVKIGNFWFPRDNVMDICDRLGLQHVPIIGQWKLLDIIYEMINAGHVPLSLISDNAEVEGYVATPLIPLHSNNGRVIVKLKYKDLMGLDCGQNYLH